MECGLGGRNGLTWPGWRCGQAGNQGAGQAQLEMVLRANGGGGGVDRGRGRQNWERDTVSWLPGSSLADCSHASVKRICFSRGVHPCFASSLSASVPHFPSQPHRVSPKLHLPIMGFLEQQPVFQGPVKARAGPRLLGGRLSWQHTGGLGWEWAWPFVPLLHHSTGLIGELSRGAEEDSGWQC